MLVRGYKWEESDVKLAEDAIGQEGKQRDTQRQGRGKFGTR